MQIMGIIHKIIRFWVSFLECIVVKVEKRDCGRKSLAFTSKTANKGKYTTLRKPADFEKQLNIHFFKKQLV